MNIIAWVELELASAVQHFSHDATEIPRNIIRSLSKFSKRQKYTLIYYWKKLWVFNFACKDWTLLIHFSTKLRKHF